MAYSDWEVRCLRRLETYRIKNTSMVYVFNALLSAAENYPRPALPVPKKKKKDMTRLELAHQRWKEDEEFRRQYNRIYYNLFP